MLRGRQLLILAPALIFAAGCANRPPTITCTPDQVNILENDSANLQVEGSDPNKRDLKKLTYSWSADQGKLAAQGTKATFDSSGLKPGKYSVKAEVSDRKLTASCSVDVNVAKRKFAPTIACEPGTASVTEGGSVTLRARASDANNDPLTYAWTVDGQAVTNNQPEFNFGSTGRSLGDHTARVTVTDVDGMSAGCDFRVTINRRPNRNPSVSLSLDKTEVYAGDTVQATATGRDPDNDPLTYAWTVDGQARSERGNAIQVSSSGMGGGGHGVVVTVRDDRGATATDTKSFAVREKMVVQVDARVDNVAKAKLDELALKMQQDARLKAVLTGHTDERGSERARQQAAAKRAEMVKDYLVKQHKIDAGRLETRSAGSSQLVAESKTAEGRKQNRRVEIELYVP